VDSLGNTAQTPLKGEAMNHYLVSSLDDNLDQEHWHSFHSEEMAVAWLHQQLAVDCNCHYHKFFVSTMVTVDFDCLPEVQDRQEITVQRGWSLTYKLTVPFRRPIELLMQGEQVVITTCKEDHEFGDWLFELAGIERSDVPTSTRKA
jgi:hypothetical protein